MNFLSASPKRVLAVAVIILLLGATTPASADTLTIGEPNLNTTIPEPELEATSAQTLDLRITNNGEVIRGGEPEFEAEVKTAQNVRVRILENRIDAPIDIKSGTQTIGTFPDGETVPVSFAVEVGDAEPGTYQIPVSVEYSYTRSVSYGPFEQPDRQTTSEDNIQYVTVQVEDKPQFAMVSEEGTEVVAGDNGDLAFTFENSGTREATDVRVTFATSAAGVFFGQQTSSSASTSRAIGSLAPGEQETVTVNAGASEAVSQGTYPVPITIEYENANGITEQADSLQASLTVLPDRSFRLSNVTTTDFRVDEPEAQVRATLTNDGPTAAENVVVRIANQQQLPVTATSGEAAVGSLAAGESAPVRFTVSIPEDAEPSSISVPLAVEYENADGDVLQPSTPLRQRLTVGPEQDQFQVIGTNTTVTPGGSAQLDVRFRYTGNETIRNANAKFFTSDPLSSSDDGAYLGTVNPGETTTATFRVSATGSALPKEYSSSVEVRYEEPDGDTRFTGSLNIGVPISSAEDSGLPLLPAVAVGTVLAIGGVAFIYQRR